MVTAALLGKVATLAKVARAAIPVRAMVMPGQSGGKSQGEEGHGHGKGPGDNGKGTGDNGGHGDNGVTNGNGNGNGGNSHNAAPNGAGNINNGEVLIEYYQKSKATLSRRFI
jgi:hypothetical protein